MDSHNIALVIAGVIGSCVAVVHGVLMERHIVKPLVQMAQERRMRASLIRLAPVLLHFTTFSWVLGGLALIAAASWFGRDARLTTILFVGGSYIFGVLGNLWATRGRHAGWMLLGMAVVLIAYGSS